jgi:hypothetical protein
MRQVVSQRSRILVVVTVALSASVSCTDNIRNVDDAHHIFEHYFPLDLSDAETTKEVSCDADEVLLGAGFIVNGVSLSVDNAIAIQANHPTTENGWLLKVVRDPASSTPAVSVSLYLYCMTRTDGASLTISSHAVSGSSTTLTRRPSGVATGEAAVPCPGGEDLTSGGFEMTLARADPTAAVYNSWIWSSQPAANRSSWEVEGAFIENGDPLPSMRPYALCVSDPDDVLRSSDAADVAAVRANGYNYDFYEGVAPCGERAIATGGGFQFAGDRLVPHVILTDMIGAKFAGWRARGVFGFQTGTSAALTIRPLCFASLPIERPPDVDLKPVVGPDPLHSTGCPDNAPTCFTFSVINDGSDPAPPSEAAWDGPGPAVRTNVPSLAAGQSADMTIAVPNPCTTDCAATITADPDHKVRESNEANNVFEWFVVG